MNLNDNGPQQGLYLPQLESDACGTALIAQLNGDKSNEIVQNALHMLCCMEHRGAQGADPLSGDGAGILTQMPDTFLRVWAEKNKLHLPKFGAYGLGMFFLPSNNDATIKCKLILDDLIDELDFERIAYRSVPTNREGLSDSNKESIPLVNQVIVKPKKELDPKTLERKLFVLRNYASHQIQKLYPHFAKDFYFSSFSYKTVVYKGQLTPHQLVQFYPDLHDPNYNTAIALVHSRFSTNTIPQWKLAQPFRYIAHNGEINTITGNLNWWRSKEKQLFSEVFDQEDLKRLLPIIQELNSDSGHFDNILEMLLLSGRSLPHSLMMMIPEAWEQADDMPDHKKAFYEYYEHLIEAWDGPASICFTDGILVGATLDRNGLRPSRYLLTKNNTLVVASEAGVFKTKPENVVLKGRLQPGKMLIADLDEHRIIGDTELKSTVCTRLPYRSWLDSNLISIDQLLSDKKQFREESFNQDLSSSQKLFGYTKEDLKFILGPMVEKKKDPIGSMGIDTPLAILSKRPQHLSNYFKQSFAQVTNPPIDPIREKSVMSLTTRIGHHSNILLDSESQCKSVKLNSPILDSVEFGAIKNHSQFPFERKLLDITFDANSEKGTLKAALENLCAQVEQAFSGGINIFILSDRNHSKNRAPIPSLLAVGAIHHRLLEKGIRHNCSIILDIGDCWQAHHFATLIGFGADAIHPYLAYESLVELNKKNYFSAFNQTNVLCLSFKEAIQKGLLKIMSKIGISTIQSYRGAQLFEALGIHPEVIKMCFNGTISRIKGISFEGIAKEAIAKHHNAYSELQKKRLESGGIFQWKRDGEYHLFNPQSIHLLQVATRKKEYHTFKKYSHLIDNQERQACTLRGLLEFRKGHSIPLDEVESTEKIVQRFSTGAMSFGSISHEAHTTLAIAMNRMKAKSNSGEGGEDPIRNQLLPNGDSVNSAIKQVASGRFGVTSFYLSTAKEIQIKMAQGAKPGEGGQLPGHKVNDWIAKVRHATPGVGLISPPPHHDIYSIEDLAQLIFDLKNANKDARINVKLVSKAGVGIIASGVAKAHAEAILISGHDGGTGASPWTSINHAGLPWELGLAESHQVLLKNRLRDRVVLQTDGQIRTGKDLAIAILLGAEEWGVATAALVAEGCILMRKCHQNTCPVGIATQNPELRENFSGKPEYIINFFHFLAEELREIMANLGFRTINEMVGKSEMLKPKSKLDFWKWKSVDLGPLLFQENITSDIGQYQTKGQSHGLEHQLDRKIIASCKDAINAQTSIEARFPIKNTDRAVGTMLSHQISKLHGLNGLAANTIQLHFTGSAGQSFAAFGAPGIAFHLVGEANDYLGKGLSGSTISIKCPSECDYDPKENIIIGNVALYGATSGNVYINGQAGERFAVRNSGASAVVEGIGDHGCEYMTGGRVIVLGETGKNFGAGMSGGKAFIYDPKSTFSNRYNPESIDLDPVLDSEKEELKKEIQQHFNYTKSALAKEILDSWEIQWRYFKLVMPKEYKAALLKNKLQNLHKKLA